MTEPARPPQPAADPNPVTAATALTAATQWEQEAFIRDAERVAQAAAHIAANPPTAERTTVSGDLTRLSQNVADLLRRAAKIEANFQALSLMNATDPATEKRGPHVDL
ncbi:hypothetical protein PYK79_10740 [Streptomyces sp. ID05-04B]|uniref:hypothetical protein n=1 Tax=Streptomyces sp. ID05-04B TaxID=3028661 RepID=UPI0029C16169|nr:hypothetical protein [Streptomyces sp. ID05-04B]MDX5563729.1 hypothetical protein [Streptomyces sp. ID05-04B]